MGRYTNKQLLGEGASGYVISAMDTKRKEEVAIKVISINNENDLINFEKEVSILTKLKHKNIIKIHANSKSNLNETSKLIVLEKMETDLHSFMNTNDLSCNLSISIFLKVCNGLRYCHSKKIAHLDIKPENILISNNAKIVKLTDFGGSCSWSSSNVYVKKTTSTLVYSSPEMSFKKKFLGDKADIWSLGVLLHLLFTNDWPFGGTTEEEAIMYSKRGEIKILPSFPSCLVPLLTKMLHYNPMARPSVKVIINEIIKYI